MKIRHNVYYIALTDSLNKEVKANDEIYIKKRFTDSNYYNKYGIQENTNYYVLFLPVKDDASDFFGMKAMNRTEYFQNISDIEEFLMGCEIGYDYALANSLIASYQKKIDNIKKLHEIL